MDAGLIGERFLAEPRFLTQFPQVSGKALANVVHRQTDTVMTPIRLQTISDKSLDFVPSAPLRHVTDRRHEGMLNGLVEAGKLVPRGSHHVLTCVLRSGRDCLELHVEGGGYWFIDPPSWSKARRLIGRRVIVQGVRAGFNLLDATKIVEAADLDGDSSGQREVISRWARLANRANSWRKRLHLLP